jgi:CheY-like chemotaxis protein
MRILVVEDQAAVRQALDLILQPLGHEMAYAQDTAPADAPRRRADAMIERFVVARGA